MGQRGTKPLSLAERFWARVERTPSCWLWTGATFSAGYGHLQRGPRGGGTIGAHRVAYELAFGPLPVGQLVLHHCDNPPCVRPSHLFAGTKGDNARDMAAKGRQWKQAGPNRRNKLTAENVVEIRRLSAMHVAQRVIAAQFGVHPVTVTNIVARRSWKSV